MMRISSFTLVSWLGPQSPFMFVWVVNTCDAVLLTWCEERGRLVRLTIVCLHSRGFAGLSWIRIVN